MADGSNCEDEQHLCAKTLTCLDMKDILYTRLPTSASKPVFHIINTAFSCLPTLIVAVRVDDKKDDVVWHESLTTSAIVLDRNTY